MTAPAVKAGLAALPLELHDDIMRRLDWRTALQLMRTCRTFHMLLTGKSGLSIWRRFYHTSFPPCDRECKLYLWLLSRQRRCSIEQAARVAPALVDWPDLFHRRYQLERNWRTGNSTRHVVTFPGISCDTDAELEARSDWWHGLILAASAAGCLLRHMQAHRNSLYLVENRPDATAVPLQFGSFSQSRIAPYSFVNKPHYVHINDQYVVLVAMLVNPDEDVMCIWRWDDPAGRLLGHWTLPFGHDSIIVDLYGRWLLWMADGKSMQQDMNHPLYPSPPADPQHTSRPKDLFYIHDLSSPARNRPVLSLEARAGCIHVQPNRRSGTGRIDDERISVFLVDAKEDGSISWEQWSLRSGDPTDASSPPPVRTRHGVVSVPIVGVIDYIWTMRMAESDDSTIYTLAVQSNCKWEMVISTRDNKMQWIRPSADAPGNLIMGHGLLMIDAYEPEELVNSSTSTLFEPLLHASSSSAQSSPSIEPNRSVSSLIPEANGMLSAPSNVYAPAFNAGGMPIMFFDNHHDHNHHHHNHGNHSDIDDADDADDDNDDADDNDNDDDDGQPQTQHPMLDITTLLNSIILGDHSMMQTLWPANSAPTTPAALSFAEAGGELTTATTATTGTFNGALPGQPPWMPAAVLTTPDTQLAATNMFSPTSTSSSTDIAGVQQTVIIDIRTGNTLYRSAPLADRNTMVVVGPLVLVNHRHRNRWRTFLIDVETGRSVRSLTSEENGYSRELHSSATHIPVIDNKRRLIIHDFSVQC